MTYPDYVAGIDGDPQPWDSTAETVWRGQHRMLNNAEDALQRALDYLVNLQDVAEQVTDPLADLDNLGYDDAALANRLTDAMDNWSYGLPDSLAQQIWDKARERTNAAMNANIAEQSRRLSAAGWELPQGVLVEAIQQATQAAALEAAAHAREVAIEQWKSEVDMFKFLIDAELKRLAASTQNSAEAVRLAIARMQANVGYLMDAARAGAQISTQLAASALSTVNFNSGMSWSESASAGSHVGVSYSVDAGEGSAPGIVIPFSG